jgi:hypothetical protein
VSTPPPEVMLLLREQDGALTTSQALSNGMTPRQLRTLVANGWGHPHRGVFVSPMAPDPFRASVRAALLASPQAVACRVTAARLHELWGLPVWSISEKPQLILPAGVTHNPRVGTSLHSGLITGEATSQRGFATTTLARTMHDLACVLSLDDLVCAVDFALRLGWVPSAGPERGRRKLSLAVALADARSESPLETLARLLLVSAGIPPEVLQLSLRDDHGRVLARWDMAWPSALVAVELDGREYHDGPEPLYRDRIKGNAAAVAGWRVLRFTWYDVTRQPKKVVATIMAALAGR